MSDDFKIVLLLLAVLFALPLLGLGVSEHTKLDCRMQMAKVGRPLEEIKEICK